VRAGGKLVIEGASVIVMALYSAVRPRMYRDGVLSLVAPKHRAVGARVLDDASATLRAWVVGQLLAMLVLGVLTALGLWALGVPYWLAFGIFTGLVAVVPFFGTLVSTLLPALFVVGTGDWLRVLAVIALGVVVHVIEANVVVPRIMEQRVALPPVLTIAGVLIMGTLLGVVGLVVAVPVLAVAMVVLRHVVQAEVYGDTGHLEPAVLRATGEHRSPRAARGPAPPGVARLAQDRARAGPRHLEWPSLLHRGRSGAGRPGPGEGRAHPRRAQAASQPAYRGRARGGRRGLRDPHRGLGLQRRQDDRAAPAARCAGRAGPSRPLRGDGPDRDFHRGVGHRRGCGRGGFRRRR